MTDEDAPPTWTDGGAKLHLTQSRVDTLKPEKVILDVRDSELKGLGIRITPSRTRRYFIHSQHEGRRIWKTFDDAVTVVQARQRARAMLAASGNRPDAAHNPPTRR